MEFGAGGTTYVDGEPFFPVGIFTYSLDGTVLDIGTPYGYQKANELTRWWWQRRRFLRRRR